MELMLAIVIGVLTTSGVYLSLRAQTFSVVLGLTMLSYAVNLFLFVMGRVLVGHPAVVDVAATAYADPLPQALVLTAIVIAFGMTAFVIVLSLRALVEMGNDHVDGLHIEHPSTHTEPHLPHKEDKA